MSGIILCTKKSDVPYKLEDTDLNIYSIEELAYYLYNNAYFVDESFFTEKLVDYIEKNLGLNKVSQRLKYAIGQKMDFSELVMTIITGSMYYRESEIKAFEKELKSIGSKSMLERMNARAKMLYDNGKIASAKLVYENILSNNTYKKQNDEFYSNVRVGLGKVYCRMFYYDKAIEEFSLAYQLHKSRETLKSLVNAKLVSSYSGKDFLKFENVQELLKDEIVIDEPLVMECIEEVKDLYEKINTSEEYEKVSMIFKYDGRHNLDDYYDNILGQLDKWKEEYRIDMM